MRSSILYNAVQPAKLRAAMYKTVVLEFFKNNGAAVARAVGVTRSAVSQWRDIVPEAMAYRLQAATRGKLKVDPALYRKDRAKKTRNSTQSGFKSE